MESRNTSTVSRKLPSFSALRAFEQAVLWGSFKDAARELSLSTSAVSHQIRLLEKELGQCLFNRHAQGVKATAVANYYLTIVQSSLDHLEQGTLRVKRLSTHQSELQSKQSGEQDFSD